MRIGLYANPDKDPGLRVTGRAAALIGQAGAVAIVAPDAPAVPGTERAAYATCDCLISLGGDGTFLSAVHLPCCADLPIIGVNLGRVGFLSEIQPNDLEPAVKRLVANAWAMEQRMMLDVACYDAQGRFLESGLALNDAVVSRGGRSRIVSLELTINDVLVDRIPGDGLIVSTPTGSTAYSLSAGGPIIHPELNLILITPVCPHTLHNRSYIAADASQVVVRICDYPYQALLSIDGRQEVLLDNDSTVVIRRSARSLKLIRLGPDHFYATLPQKIHARGRTYYETVEERETSPSASGHPGPGHHDAG
ncbi:MAG: NAD(+) kinase [Clostridiaceae bacterium]|jgi:NAD+ kinase|nr:NAD(+) kinase [Clostridiaceae bacterium]